MAETIPTKEVVDDDEIDLRSLFAVLWKRRKLIVFGTIGATLLSVLISLFIPRVYRSEGFYQLGSVKATDAKYTDAKNTSLTGLFPKKNIASIGVSIPLYKRSAARFSNPNRFQSYAGQDKALNEENMEQIRMNFRTAGDIDKWIKPVYTYAKEDTREFAQLPRDESNSVIGLNLAYEADSPQDSNNYVRLFGNYVRDCLLYITLYNYITDGNSDSKSEVAKTENVIINTHFQLLQSTNKMKDIRAILTNYPESEKIENRQLVSVQDGGSRFLSPVTQLVGLESALADLRRTLSQLERDKEIAAMRAEYFSRCNNEMANIGEFGLSLFSMLKSLKEDAFKNKDLSKDTVKEVSNDLDIDMQTIELAYFNNCRFVSGPTTPDMHIRPRKSLIVIASCLGSFFLLIILAFILHWWQANKKIILSPSSRIKG